MSAVGGGESPTAAVVRELLALGVLTVDDAVEQGFALTETSVSHRSYRVRIGAADGLFVKQADPVRSQGRDLSTEAAVYRIARSSEALAGVVPACHAVAADDSLLVLDAVPGTPLSDTALAQGGLDPGTRSAMCAYGRAVARVHRVRPPPIGHPPWLLSALEPGWGGYGWLPGPCRELLVRLAATREMREGFRRAASAWQAGCLVHGDLRWANVLVALDEEPPRAWLVDWELACLGDAAWDVGSVLADLLAAAASRSLEAGDPPGVWEPALAFLGGYRTAAALPEEEWTRLVRRSVALAGVRLVQALVEYGHQGAAFLAPIEPVLLPWAATLLGAPHAIVSELAHARECSCGQ